MADDTAYLAQADLGLLHDFFLAALREDVGTGDITARATAPSEARAMAHYAAKGALIVAGAPVIGRVASLVDPALEFRPVAADGDSLEAGAVLAELRGGARSILTAERVTLNLLQRLCGIATLTRAYVERVSGTGARILDTRKTAPGLRVLDKYAVRCGGGMNHRMGLFDGVLIKNNHLAFHASVAAAIAAARRNLGHLVKIEVEVHRLEQLDEAIGAGADVVLLDNFTADEARQAVRVCAGRVPLEASGNMTLDRVRAFAEAGVQYISVGALTHSAPAADIHLRVTPS